MDITEEVTPEEDRARKEIQHWNRSKRISRSVREAIYNVLRAYPAAGLVKVAKGEFTVEVLGEKNPGVLGCSNNPESAWLRAATKV